MTPFYDAAIIGAGFSGTMTAVQLARESQGTLRVLLIERRDQPGRGLAYGTTDPCHLLNVRAGRMGAFPEDPAGFYDWLRDHPDIVQKAGVAALTPESFMPRLLFGAYLQDVLARVRAAFPTLQTAQADVTGLVPEGEQGYTLFSQGAPLARARAVVLALGHFPPGESALINPYSPALAARLAEPGDVFLIGTGLTSLDLIATMRRTKAQGVIHVLSRSGLFPKVHEETEPYPPFFDPDHPPKTAMALWLAVRREIRAAKARGIGWQSVWDSLRPLNQTLWQALPITEQRRLLRHVRPYWDTHRHRCAAEIMAARDGFRAEGRLIQHRGAFIAMRETAEGVAVTWKPARSSRPETTLVRCAVSCTGPQADCRKLDDPLVRDVLSRDLITPHPLGISVDTAQDGALKNSLDEIVPHLYTLGPWRRGTLYESVAVPELREQAADLVRVVIRGLGV